MKFSTLKNWFRITWMRISLRFKKLDKKNKSDKDNQPPDDMYPLF